MVTGRNEAAPDDTKGKVHTGALGEEPEES